MPKFLENVLRSGAAKKGFTGKRADRYVYGAMNNLGAMRGNKETEKGATMDRKHARKVEGESHSFNFRNRHGQKKVKLEF